MEKILRTSKMIIGLALLYFLIMGILLGAVMIFTNNYSEYSMIITGLTGIITLIVLYMFYGRNKNIVDKYKFKKITWRNTLYIILFSCGMSIIISIVGDFVIEFFPSYKSVDEGVSSLNSSIVNIIFMVVLIPIFEEILFRGVIFNHLKENYKIGIAVILQALLFGIAHGNIFQGLYAFTVGIFLALIYMYCNSMYGNIIFHMIFNLFGTVIISMLQSMNDLIYYTVSITFIVLSLFASFKMISNYRIDKNR